MSSCMVHRIRQPSDVPSAGANGKEFVMSEWPNHALQRTRRERRNCNRCVSCAESLSLGRYTPRVASTGISSEAREGYDA
jgi:hypothetical protein